MYIYLEMLGFTFLKYYIRKCTCEEGEALSPMSLNWLKRINLTDLFPPTTNITDRHTKRQRDMLRRAPLKKGCTLSLSLCLQDTAGKSPASTVLYSAVTGSGINK